MSLRWLVLPAAVLAIFIDAVYWQLVGQGIRNMPLPYRVPFVAGFIFAMAVAATASLEERLRELRSGLLALSATGLLALGWLAIFSIGLPLLIVGSIMAAAAFAAVIASSQPRGALMAVGGVLVALAVLVAGFELTDRMISCPSTGWSSGGGNHLVTGAYHYQCLNGHLTVRPGLCTHMGARTDPSGNVISTTDC